MKRKSKNRILYAAEAVFFAALFLSDAIEMAMLWDSYTMPKVILTSIHLLAWIAMAWYCANEFKIRLEKSRDVKRPPSRTETVESPDNKEIRT